jgi:hypothetical protein
MYPIRELKALAALFGGQDKLAMELGCKVSTIQTWHQRRNIPQSYWDKLIHMKPEGLITKAMLNEMKRSHIKRMCAIHSNKQIKN